MFIKLATLAEKTFSTVAQGDDEMTLAGASGLDIAKAYCVGTGGHKAGVLLSSFVAEVKSDLMGEQTILCGLLPTGSILSFNKMMEQGIDAGYASKLVQYGWEVITEALKIGDKAPEISAMTDTGTTLNLKEGRTRT